MGDEELQQGVDFEHDLDEIMTYLCGTAEFSDDFKEFNDDLKYLDPDHRAEKDPDELHTLMRDLVYNAESELLENDLSDSSSNSGNSNSSSSWQPTGTTQMRGRARRARPISTDFKSGGVALAMSAMAGARPTHAS
jgi:hypothetical protein